MAVLVLTSVSLIWPVYPFFSGTYPLILGLPFSLAWVILWLAIVFVALAWLFTTESR